MAQPDSSMSSEMETSSSPTPEELNQPVQTLGAPKRRGLSPLVAILVVIVVVLAAALAYESLVLLPKPTSTPPPPPPPVNKTVGPMVAQALTTQVSQGQQVTFALTNLTVGAMVIAQMGDGGIQAFRATGNASTFTYSYNTGGQYLVWIQEVAANGTLIADLRNSLTLINVVPSVPTALSAFETAPLIFFNPVANPSAPIVATGASIQINGTSPLSPLVQSQDFFSSTVTNRDNTTTKTSTTVKDAVSPSQFEWNLGNGQTASTAVSFDPNTGAVVPDSHTTSYGVSGLYTVSLTLVNTETQTITVTTIAANGTLTNKTTTTSSTIASFSYTVGQTIAAGSFQIAKNQTAVTSAGTITEVVNSPGGPYSFDPQIDYETTGAEVVFNTMGTLLFYQGNSTTQFIPYLADSVPTAGNGIVNNQNYTFHIRSGEYFSNGDPVTAYDVWYTMMRAMLFQGGYPGTANWIIAQYLIPPAPSGPFSAFTPLLNSGMSPTQLASVAGTIYHSITWDNTSNTVTFHLWRPTPPGLFFTAIVDPLGCGILDASWLQSVGAGITISPQGFLAYEDQANEGSYNANVQFGPVASGPYQISVYTPGTAVVLKPNPGWPGTNLIPHALDTVVLKWVLDPTVAYQLFTTNQADIVTLLPSPYYPQVQKSMVNTSQAFIHGPVPALTEFFWVFNVNVSLTALSTIGPGYSVPQYYFANPLVRKAFAYAFDYVNFIENVSGNAKYGFNFGNNYCGVIIKGLPYHTSNLTGCPSYDTTMAHNLLLSSGLYNTTINIPLVVPTGDPVDYLAGTIWASELNIIDPHITAAPAYLPFSTIIGNSVPGGNGMPIYNLGWIADYPYPSDFVDAMYLVGGTYPGPNGWDPASLQYLSTLNGGMYTTQYNTFQTLTTQIHTADADSNPVNAAADYQAAEQSAVNLYMYVYTIQDNSFWIARSYMSPFLNNWGYQTAPTMGAAQDSLFFYWVKG